MAGLESASERSSLRDMIMLIPHNPVKEEWNLELGNSYHLVCMKNNEEES
jgi:hypothetical protein